MRSTCGAATGRAESSTRGNSILSWDPETRETIAGAVPAAVLRLLGVKSALFADTMLASMRIGVVSSLTPAHKTNIPSSPYNH